MRPPAQVRATRAPLARLLAVLRVPALAVQGPTGTIAPMRPPVITDPDHALAWLLDEWPCDEDALLTVLARVGRANGPYLLASLFDELNGGIEPGLVAAAVGAASSATNFPEDDLHRDTWTALFEAAGYTVDGRQAQRPTEALQLYRGAPEHRRTGMSWTSDPTMAEKFASGDMWATEPGQVWTALVEPWRLYCHDNDRQEAEYVITTDGLDITALRA